MPLISPKKHLEEAKSNFTALPHFNVNNLEMVKSVVEVVNEKSQPAFLAITENAIKYAGFEYLVDIVKTAGKLSKTDLFLHLDHGKSKSVIKKAIEAGFNSIMYDGSSLPESENIAKTKEIKKMIGEKDTVLEAEIGHVGKLSGDEGLLSQPEDVEEFIKQTNADTIAVSIGSVHGIVKDQQLDFKRLEEIREKVDVPLVIHGCSGLEEKEIKKLVASGANKFNFDSEIRAAFMEGLRENINESDPRRVLSASMMEMKEVIKQKINWVNN